MAKLAISGDELKRYWEDQSEWGDHREISEMTIFINGEEDRDADITSLADTDVVTIADAYVYDHTLDKALNLISLIKSWRKRQRQKRLLVTVDEEHLESLLTAIKSVPGAKIIQ